MTPESVDNATPAAGGADGPFRVKDCALVAIATGEKALTLKELRQALADITPDSIYHHFWGGLLQTRFEEREYNNDFSAWARRGLHDDILAERLAMLDPTEFDGLEALRAELLEVLDERLDQSEYLTFMRATEPFEFLRSQIVVFDTQKRVAEPADLARLLPGLSTGSVFYHFIDARRRLPGRRDDFSLWLASFGSAYEELCGRLAGVDPYFGSLGELRRQLVQAFEADFGALASP